MRDPSDKVDKRVPIVAALASLLLAWLIVLWPLPQRHFKESDTFWLIEVGNYILQHRALPATDSYSFASLQTPWILYQWLSEVVFSLANAFGLTGVSILGEVTFALLLCVLMFRRMIKVGANSIVAFVVIGIVVGANYPDIAAVRPQLFSFVFLFYLQTMVEDVWSGIITKQQWRSVLAKTFVIGLLWVNFHLSFPLGLVVLGVYLVADSIKWARFARVMPAGSQRSQGGVMPSEAGAPREESALGEESKLAILGAMTLVYFVATLINPYGVGLFVYFTTLPGMYLTQELEALSWSKSSVNIIVYCALLFCTLYLWKTAARPKLVLAVVLFGYGCLHGRLIVYFCLSSCPLIGKAVSQMLSSITRRSVIGQLSDAIKDVAFKKYYPLAIIAMSVLIVLARPMYISKNVSLKAAEYLDAHHPSGNLFCSAHAGSYLIYRFHGAIKVFIDTRVDLYDPNLVNRYVAAMNGSGWKELFGEYKISETLLPNACALNEAIEKDQGWKKIYADDDFTICRRISGDAG